MDQLTQKIERLLNSGDAIIENHTTILTQYMDMGDVGITAESGVAVPSVENATRDNEGVSTFVAGAVNAINKTLAAVLYPLRSWIMLLVPKIADGGNFGVSVQLAVLKTISDSIEKLEKLHDELTKYRKSRGDMVEKLGVPTTTKTVTSTKGVDSTEEKEETKVSEGTVLADQLAAVAELDNHYFALARRALISASSAEAVVISTVLKNREKIEAPVQSGGGSGHYTF